MQFKMVLNRAVIVKRHDLLQDDLLKPKESMFLVEHTCFMFISCANSGILSFSEAVNASLQAS